MKNVCGLLIVLSFVSCGKDKIKEIKGTDGISCHAESVEGGTNIICGDSTSFIPNGVDGVTPDLEYVTVCPDIPGPYPEVLLYIDGKYMAFLSDGNYERQRLVVLQNGTYKTTDGRDAYFQISGSDLICR